MLIEKIIEFESRVPGPLVVHVFLELVIFMMKQKSSKANPRVHCLMLKMLQKTMYLDFPDSGQVTKFNPKMQDFKHALTWVKVKGVIFSIDFQTSKTWFSNINWLSNIKNIKKWLWKREKCDPNCIKIAIVFEKITKNCPTAGDGAPMPPLWYVLSCTNLLTTSPNFDRREKFFTCGFSPSFIANSDCEPNQTPSFWSFILCAIKSPSFQ